MITQYQVVSHIYAKWTQKVIFVYLYICIYVTIVTKEKEMMIHESRSAWRQRKRNTRVLGRDIDNRN